MLCCFQLYRVWTCVKLALVWSEMWLYLYWYGPGHVYQWHGWQSPCQLIWQQVSVSDWHSGAWAALFTRGGFVNSASFIHPGHMISSFQVCVHAHTNTHTHRRENDCWTSDMKEKQINYIKKEKHINYITMNNLNTVLPKGKQFLQHAKYN